MPTVTLVYSNGTIQPPDTVRVTPGDQTITWILPAPPTWPAQPIVFKTPPSGYNHWPGSAPVVNGNTVTVDTKKPLSPGQARQRYKYDIFWNGGELDPDIENGAGSTDGGGGKGKGPKKR
jgi:hypothetical protein